MPESNQFDRLAVLAAQLGDRSRQLEGFRQLLQPLQQGGLEAVDGESAVLVELDSKLKAAFDILDHLSTGNAAALIDELARSLNDVDWEVAEELRTDLEARFRHQSEVLSAVDLDLRAWEGQVTEFAKIIENSRFEGAPFTSLESDLLAARSALNGIKSAQTTRNYKLLPALQQSAKEVVGLLEKHVKELTSQVDRVKKLVKQADLLIMQVGLEEGNLEYRVLLRSADRFQTRGINIIQDVRKVSKADREWMVGLLNTLTCNMNDGIRAAHDAMHPAPAGMPRTILPADHDVEALNRNTTHTLGMLGEFMFRMVIPEQIQAYLKRESCSFSITTNDLQLPWELICYDASNTEGVNDLRYLCLERSVSRMPLGNVFPPSPPRRTPGLTRRRRMLLIHSDPQGNLPAAAEEVETIARELAGQLDVERVAPSEATNSHINELLMGKSFDFLHYAGHARFDTNSPNLSGLQLKDSVLTAEKIRLLNKGGSLVFLNACESGTVAREDKAQHVSYLLNNPEPVVGLASAFVYSGALGCVGSLWPVYDRPAAELAVRFYRNVLSGEPTGEALRRAREEIRAAYPRENTWAGYVLYGDPTFRLVET